MYRKLTILTTLLLAVLCLNANSSIKELMPVWGFSVAAPGPQGVDQFVTFIEEELATRNINVLILRVDYNYQFDVLPSVNRKGFL